MDSTLLLRTVTGVLFVVALAMLVQRRDTRVK